MKKACLLVMLMCLSGRVLAQDSVQNSYSEQAESFDQQLVVDKYEKVFMTMVPTRHMFKAGLSQYYQALFFPLIQDGITTSASLHLGYEFKVLPSFSLAFSSHFPAYALNFPLDRSIRYTVVDAQLRWFVDMKSRIRKQKSANNFSGNYVAINYTVPGFAHYFEHNPSYGLKFGFQRRVLNTGFMDFAFALQQRGQFHYGLFHIWTFSTQATVGFAIGDWKKAKTGPLCDFLLCDPQIRSQWKIRLPEISLGYHLNKIKVGIAYEHKVGTLPLTLNYQLDIGLNRGWNYMYTGENLIHNVEDYYNLVTSRELNSSFSIQPRYYFLQNRQRLNGRSGNGLSGLYTGIHTEYNHYWGRHNSSNGRNDFIIRNNIIKAGPLAGFQQRLFKKGYLDFNASYNLEKKWENPHVSSGFTAYLGVGLAL